MSNGIEIGLSITFDKKMIYPRVHKRTLYSLELAVKVATLADGTNTYKQIAEKLGLTRAGVQTLLSRTNNCYKQLLPGKEKEAGI